MTNYERNKKGEYTAKTYFYYDSLGQIEGKYTSVWKFEFNKKGQKIRETLIRATNTLRVNELSYDKDGNYAGQLTDSTHKWTFEYDNKRNVIERREWSCRKDSVLCLKLTKYKYENDRLTSEISQSPKDFEVWNDFAYEYDTKGNLVYVIEKRTYWTRQNNGPLERHVLEYKTKLENDIRGFVRLKSVYTAKEENPTRCIFYDYVYRGN